MLTSTAQEPMRAEDKINGSPLPETVAAAPSDGDEREIRYGFFIGPLGLLVGHQTVAEVIVSPSVYSVPRMPDWLRGVMNHGGNIVPVFDLRRILIPNDACNNQRPVLVLGRDADTVGILIDGLPKALPVTDERFDMPALPAIAKDYIAPAFRSMNSCWMELDHRKLLKRLAKEYEKYAA